jgi:hypothetical protein
MKIITICFICLYVTQAIAANKCVQFRNNGWWKKYKPVTFKYKPRDKSELGILFSTSDYTSQASTQNGVGSTSESTTSLLDPGYTSNNITSIPQITSSWGACSLFGSYSDMRNFRDMYFAQNKDEFLKELAQGNGKHLEVMAFFARCNTENQNVFNSTMQRHYSELIIFSKNNKIFMDKFDSYLITDLHCNLGNS